MFPKIGYGFIIAQMIGVKQNQGLAPIYFSDQGLKNKKRHTASRNIRFLFLNLVDRPKNKQIATRFCYLC